MPFDELTGERKTYYDGEAYWQIYAVNALDRTWNG